jgi:hypothetical protein
MTVHKHVMALVGEYFICEVCTARVEMVPQFNASPRGVRIVSSARVCDAGRGGFTVAELGGLARLWLKLFREYVRDREPVRPGRRARRGGGWSAPELVYSGSA